MIFLLRLNIIDIFDNFTVLYYNMTQLLRGFMRKISNIRISKKFIALVTSMVLGVTGYLSLENNSGYSEGIIINENDYNKGDSVITTKNVNMRLGTSKETFKIGAIEKGTIVDRIISLNGFDLVRYNNQIAFVSCDFTDSSVPDYNNEYYRVVEDNDIIHTTTKVYFRLGPSTNEKDIDLLSKGEELTVLGKAINIIDESDVWYLAKYKDKIGFIKADYTVSLKSTIQSIDSSITKVEIKNIGYIKENCCIYDSNNIVINYIEQYQVVKVLGEINNYCIVEYNNTIGLILKNNIKTYNGIFVVVDLSDQRVFLYCNTDMVFESFCTTGSDLAPTRTGAFSVYERTNSRYFSETAESKYMWANFDHGNGLHDAPWENPTKFGSQKYRKKNGSKGCVRLPDETAIFLKEYVKKGTKVLVKE